MKLASSKTRNELVGKTTQEDKQVDVLDQFKRVQEEPLPKNMGWVTKQFGKFYTRTNFTHTKKSQELTEDEAVRRINNLEAISDNVLTNPKYLCHVCSEEVPFLSVNGT